MSAAEWEKIKSESGVVEKNGEAGHAHENEKVEPMAMPAHNPTRIGTMQPAKPGNKPAGKMSEWKSHVGYDAVDNSFGGKHPTLAKAVDIGKRVVGTINEKTAGYVKDTEGVNKKLKELEKEKGEEDEEPEKKSKNKSKRKKKSKGDEFDFDDEDDEDITALHKSTSKQKVLPGDYKPAYGSGMGKKGYESVYTASIGSGIYQPAYKPTVREPTVGEPPKTVKSAVEELAPQSTQPIPRPTVDRFNTRNWQSVGFPNTLPQNARGSLFRPAPQQQVVPMVQQPYQPRQPVPTPMPQQRPMAEPLPRISLNLNIPQSQPRPATPTHASTHVVHQTTPVPAPMTFMGVNLSEKKKQEPKKPLTRMGEGYKNAPLYMMNSFYPTSGYNPSKDPITKKSIIPKIHATVSPNDFTMFGMKVKNKKN
jgi:hypothetical protein